jgi:hypothetical protein
VKATPDVIRLRSDPSCQGASSARHQGYMISLWGSHIHPSNPLHLLEYPFYLEFYQAPFLTRTIYCTVYCYRALYKPLQSSFRSRRWTWAESHNTAPLRLRSRQSQALPEQHKRTSSCLLTQIITFILLILLIKWWSALTRWKAAGGPQTEWIGRYLDQAYKAASTFIKNALLLKSF